MATSFDYKWLVEVYGDLAIEVGLRYQVPTSLVLAIMRQESSGNPLAMSPCGAIGIMQMMSGALKDFNLKFGKSYKLKDMFRAEKCADAGTGYLSILIGQFRGDVDLAIEAYNQGRTTVLKDPVAGPAGRGEWYLNGVRKHQVEIEKLLKPQMAA